MKKVLIFSLIFFSFLLLEGNTVKASTSEVVDNVYLSRFTSGMITSDGRVYTWGYNMYGQLGNGESGCYDGDCNDSNNDYKFSALPVDVTDNFNLNSNENIVMMSFGAYHTAALSSEGRVFMWGDNESGQLGDGNSGCYDGDCFDETFDYRHESLPKDITSNFILNSSEVIVQITLGDYFSAALTSEGRVFMWGDNESGQLGDGNSGCYDGDCNDETYDYRLESLPIDITSNFTLNSNEVVTEIKLGSWHSAVLTSDGRVFTWGHNETGQLGDGNNGCYDGDCDDETFDYRLESLPIDITANFGLGLNETIESIDLSLGQSAAVTSSSRVFMWGYNRFGQLGDGNSGCIDGNCEDGTVDYVFQSLPYDITSNLNLAENESVEQLELGRLHSSLVTSNGRMMTWGNNGSGQIGNGVNDGSLQPLPQDITSLFNVDDKIEKIALGHYHSAAITDKDELFLWGHNEAGQLGNGNQGCIDVDCNDETYDLYFKSLPVNITSNFQLIDRDGPTFDIINMQTIESGVSDIDWTDYIQNEQDNSYDNLTKTEVEDNVDYNTPGMYSVTVKVADESLNETSQEFTVEVEDSTPPTFTFIIKQEIDAGEFQDIDWTSLIKNESDNSDGVLTKTEVEDNVDYLNPGTYFVTVNVVDESQNERVQTFQVDVLDVTLPEFDSIDSQRIEAGSGVVDWTTLIKNESDDHSVSLTKTVTSDNVDYDTLGIYSVTVTVTDEAGNSKSQSFDVVVDDETSPTFDVVANQRIETGQSDIDWTTFIRNEKDNSDGTLLKQEVDNVNYNKPGTYTVELIVTDESGNNTTQVFSVTVEYSDETLVEMEITRNNFILLGVVITQVIAVGYIIIRRVY